MNIAFLFNSNHDDFGGSYGDPIREKVINSGVLQTCSRAKRFAEGDILTFSRSKTYLEYKLTTLSVLETDGLYLLKQDKASALLPNITICVFLIQNMSEQITREVDNYLSDFDWYLGAIEVDFSEPKHLVYFRNFLVELGRLQGKNCRLFYSMGDLENTKDIHLIKQFEETGFDTKYVDSGARRTIFDNYDTLEHFQRISELRRYFRDALEIDDNLVNEIIHNLEEANPKLFEPLHATTKALKQAHTTEEFAMAGLGCRRFMKLLTDAWFPPPKSGKHNGRPMTDSHVKNRFWNHLSDNLMLPLPETERLGKRFDTLWEKASKYLHESSPELEEVHALTRNILELVSEVISVDVDAATRPYSAYSDSINSFWSDVQKDRESRSE